MSFAKQGTPVFYAGFPGIHDDLALRERYDWGHCMDLALALHEKYGLQIEATIHDDADGGGAYIAHAWVLEGGFAIDALGAHEVDSARCEFAYAGTFTKLMTLDELRSYFVNSKDVPIEDQELVRAVVERYFSPDHIQH